MLDMPLTTFSSSDALGFRYTFDTLSSLHAIEYTRRPNRLSRNSQSGKGKLQNRLRAAASGKFATAHFE